MRKILLLLCLCTFVGVMGCSKHEETTPAAPEATMSPAAEASPGAEATPMAETSPAAEASPAASPAAP